jgi:mono/diheme cytochrome c family protein
LLRSDYFQRIAAILLVGVAAPVQCLRAADTAAGSDTAALTLFTDHVRPILVQECLKCHGGEKIKGEFDLTTRESLLHPGQDGPVVVPGHSRDSRLMKLIRHEEDPNMPEKRDQLSLEAINSIARWIDGGAPYDKPLVAKNVVARGHPTVTAEDRKFWSFTALKNSNTPAVKNFDWCRTPVDHFILRSLEDKSIAPNPIAEKRKLIRRATFDLTGLPPTPAEVEAFLADAGKDAYETLIDRLLASPRYGERWARHWLDVARFAESHGYEQDYDRPYAYVYRDFCIRAFNSDLPYDTFVKWQLAGDEIEPKNRDALAATGFLAAGTHATQITANQAEKERYDELDDIANTTGTAFLGLTIGCARCHDHKFDPIPTQDYYRFIATFTTTVRAVVLDDPKRGFIPQPTTRPDGHYPATNPSTPYMMISSEGIPAIRCHTQGPDFYPKTYFCKRGDVNQKEAEVSPGFLTVLESSPDAEKHWQLSSPPDAKTSYRRWSMANWITDTHHGAGQLLARVIVNQLWQHHFGKGLVATPNDFGAQGEKPTHPELLDYLASELIRNQWHLKPIQKLIMTSAVYMQSNEYDEHRNSIDPDNLLLWRRPLIRLEAEAIRDSMLSVSDTLNETMFGPGSLNESMNRRSIYFTVKRSRIIPLMLLFDAPNALTSMGMRGTTTVAPQALAMMNNPQMRAYAKAFAMRVVAKSPAESVEAAYRLALCRKCTGAEQSDALVFLKEQAALYAKAPNSAELALTDFCQSLLSLNEFLYVE